MGRRGEEKAGSGRGAWRAERVVVVEKRRELRVIVEEERVGRAEVLHGGGQPAHERGHVDDADSHRRVMRRTADASVAEES